jgi:hypothetical protein
MPSTHHPHSELNHEIATSYMALGQARAAQAEKDTPTQPARRSGPSKGADAGAGSGPYETRAGRDGFSDTATARSEQQATITASRDMDCSSGPRSRMNE